MLYDIVGSDPGTARASDGRRCVKQVPCGRLDAQDHCARSFTDGRRGADRGWQLFRRHLSAVLRLEKGERRARGASRRCTRRRWRTCRSGVYLHIPFCRKRCHFCYFRVYTDKNAQEVNDYLDVLAREWELYTRLPAIAGRPVNFVYFGGGTPSFLSTRQLEGLVDRLSAATPWRDAEEITFECEPGTLTEAKLAAIRRMGVTRLSLGVENFSDEILELNGRAHRSPEIFTRVRAGARARLPADQHRPDRRHARRDRGELARLR